MKKLFLMLLLIIVVPSVLAGNITRSFSSNAVDVGSELTVSLFVEVNSSNMISAIQENVPSSATMIDSGNGTFNGSIRWIENTTLLQNNTQEYIIKFSSPGNYTFSGSYAFDSYSEQTISGETNITVKEVARTETNQQNSGGGGGGGGGGGTVQTNVNATNPNTTSTSNQTQNQTNETGNNQQTPTKPGSKITTIILILLALILLTGGVILILHANRKRQEANMLKQAAIKNYWDSNPPK